MSKPYVHALSSARKFGGKWQDYIEIHQFMDSSKGAFPDNRHRALTHNAWFIGPDGPLELSFGVVIENSDGKNVSVRSIGEQHIIEDFGFIPSAQDFLENMAHKDWMSARGYPPSAKLLEMEKLERLHKKYTRD